MQKLTRFSFTLILFTLLCHTIYPQHFGRNKVTYEDFDFRVFETPHFEIYHYMDDEEEIRQFAQLTERWYERHLAIFQDTLKTKNPLILYNNHADFQQTTVIRSMIGVGTGGVTEGLRKRVVMPFSASGKETNHVLGHELVHIFHYRLFTGNGGRGLGMRAMDNIPLWMTEGQSEYLSIGSQDTQTAMWLRDAVKNDNIPTLRQMTRQPQDYFPYRWGHAFWSFFAGHYGDAQILPLYITTAQMGYQRAIDTLTGYSADSLSSLWADSIRETYEPQLEGKQESTGEKLFDANNAGNLNIAPSVSPDGRTLVFISDKNVITIDFLLADTQEKKIIRRITNILRDAHIDDYSYLESAGTWSPDGQQFAITTFRTGRNQILIADLESGRVVETIAPDNLYAFNNPAWSPDGEKILLSGLREGKSNLFLYHLETGEIEQLTDDRYDALHPEWSPDGSKIAFITDRRGNTDLDLIKYGNYKLSEYDMNSGSTEVLDILDGADIFNPKYSPDGTEIFFISNADGHRNIYRYDISAGEIRKTTDLQTGVSGITELSPGFDIARESNELVYILYSNNNYELYSENIDELEGETFSADDVDLTATLLPPADREPPTQIVEENLESFPTTDTARFSQRKDFDSKFTLEYIGSGGIGVGVSQFGAGMAGGVSFMFSDLLRENILTTSLQVQGRISDIAGQATYLNQGDRFNWGVIFSHMPYRSARSFMTLDTLNGTVAENLVILEQRVFEDELGVFGQYPLSRQLRFEGGISGNMYSFRVDSINNYFVGNTLIDREEHQLEAPETFYQYRTYLAYVGDGSRFGLTSPMSGFRYRFQIDRSFGEYSFWGLMADYRQYRFVPPVGLAFRLMHYGRYGQDAGELQPIYVGRPHFVRGYSFNALRQPQQTGGQFMSINNLVGSKIAVANAELRYPFSGPERLALISSGMFLSDLVLFADGGLAWNDFDSIRAKWNPERESDERIPVLSTGIALRVNLFNAIIVEPYFAFPFQRQSDKTTGTFGFHLSFGGF